MLGLFFSSDKMITRLRFFETPPFAKEWSILMPCQIVGDGYGDSPVKFHFRRDARQFANSFFAPVIRHV